MSVGRNDLCPCGSGKKYKKCCYLKDQGEIAEAPPHTREEMDKEIEDQIMLTQALNNFRRYQLKNKPHVKEYLSVRKMYGEIMDAMIRYYDEGKFQQKTEEAPVAASDRRTPVLHILEGSFDMDTREGSQGFYDMLIFKPALNMNCITEEFLQSRRYRKIEKIELLHSMLNSRLGLYEIVKTDPDEGYAYLKEVFTGVEHKIVDIGMSGDRAVGDYYLYMRIIAYRDISFNAGFSLIFSKYDGFINDHIRTHKKRYEQNAEFTRFIQVYNHYVQSPGKARLITNQLK